jgi:hypothetical protein
MTILLQKGCKTESTAGDGKGCRTSRQHANELKCGQSGAYVTWTGYFLTGDAATCRLRSSPRSKAATKNPMNLPQVNEERMLSKCGTTGLERKIGHGHTQGYAPVPCMVRRPRPSAPFVQQRNHWLHCALRSQHFIREDRTASKSRK